MSRLYYSVYENINVRQNPAEKDFDNTDKALSAVESQLKAIDNSIDIHRANKRTIKQDKTPFNILYSHLEKYFELAWKDNRKNYSDLTEYTPEELAGAFVSDLEKAIATKKEEHIEQIAGFINFLRTEADDEELNQVVGTFTDDIFEGAISQYFKN